MKQLSLDGRSVHRVLKLARTIADLDDADVSRANYLEESIEYRPRSLI